MNCSPVGHWLISQGCRGCRIHPESGAAGLCYMWGRVQSLCRSDSSGLGSVGLGRQATQGPLHAVQREDDRFLLGLSGQQTSTKLFSLPCFNSRVHLNQLQT